MNKVLDIGCGSGYTLSILKYFYPHVHCSGVDIIKVEELPDFIKFSKVDIENESLPFADESFELIICRGVIEHLKDPSNLFSECYRVLSKGGILHILTENYTTVFLPSIEGSRYGINFFDDPTHIRPYTKKSLYACMKIAGFKEVKVFTSRNLFFIMGLPLLFILQLTKKVDVGKLLFEAFAPDLFCEARK